jgi:nucleoporin SEH1
VRDGSGGISGVTKPAFETRSRGAPFRSFSIRHNDDTRHTYLALLAADGLLTVYENDQPENLSEFSPLDEFSVCAKPARGEETSFRVRFDPNPDVCYTSLRAGVPTDALGLVVAAMDGAKIYRTRDTVVSALGMAAAGREFYLAAEISGHRGLVRDVAWAPGNIRGYDIIATACHDGFLRVFSVTTPSPGDSTWSASGLKKHTQPRADDASQTTGASDQQTHPKSAIRAGLDQTRSGPDRRSSGQPGQIRHAVKEIAKLSAYQTPMWRVGFDDDGQILGSVGDDGKLICYRQAPDGSWAKSSELAMMKVKMAAA